MSRIESWLEQIGLPQYAEQFAEHDIDWDLLGDLSGEDLSEIGVRSLGHRKRLLKAIAERDAPAEDASPPIDPVGRADVERRQVTVLFCDLVGSTALSTKLDAEDMDALIRRYQERVTPIVREYGGHVARVVGDGILCYFGYPQALEREPERAVRAALKTVAAFDDSELHAGVTGAVRVGIATGDVVVGGVYEQGQMLEAMATGETPNLAARLQALAASGEIVVCDVTRRLVGGAIAFADGGTEALKGFAEPVQVWRATTGAADASARQRSDGAEVRLSGRGPDIAALRACWDDAAAGQGRSVLISGEAGIGKSRLFEHLDESLDEDDAQRFILRCIPFQQRTAFHPVRAMLADSAGIADGASSAVRRERLERFVRERIAHPSHLLPYLGFLLGLNEDDWAPTIASQTPVAIRQQVIESVVTLVTPDATPALILVEDVQWADQSTLQFLSALDANLSGTRMLLVMTARPEFVLDWPQASAPRRIDLGRLQRSEVLQIIDDVADGTDLTEELRSQLADRSDGIPLYAAELTRSLLDELEHARGRGIEALAGEVVSVPSSLQSGLQARLDRLPDAHEFILTCAVIGREFTTELAAHVAGTDAASTHRALAQMVDAEIIRPVAGSAGHRWEFSHALIRDAAYGNVLRRKRRALHERIASVLEERFPQAVEQQPERLAYHHRRAGDTLQAINYLQKAGAHAMETGASIEAAEHLAHGLALLGEIEDTTTRSTLELGLLMARGPALIGLRGFGAEEVEATFARAQALVEELGHAEQLFPVIRGLTSFSIVRSDFPNALRLGAEMEKIIERTGDPAQRLERAWQMGSCLMYRGDLKAALAQLETAIDLYDPSLHASHALLYGQDPGIAALTHYALALVLAGRYERALTLVPEIEAHAERADHAFSRAQANAFITSCMLSRGDLDEVERRSRFGLGFCEQQGFPTFLAHAMMGSGWVSARRGDAAGIELVRQGVELYHSCGSRLSMPFWHGLLSEAHFHCGQLDAALETVDLAIEETRTQQEQINYANLHGKRGVYLRQLGGSERLEEAEAALTTAIADGTERGFLHYALVAACERLVLHRETGRDDAAAASELQVLAARMESSRGVEVLDRVAGLLGS